MSVIYIFLVTLFFVSMVTEMKMSRYINLVSLSENLEVAPITGFKYKSKQEYAKLIEALDHQVKARDSTYDQTLGNPSKRVLLLLLLLM